MDQEETQFFDAGDNTALVCVPHQQYQKLVVPQLIDMNYKVHLGLFEEDVVLKLKTYSYDVIIIHESFKGSTLHTNPILRELIRQPSHARRESFVVLLSQRFATNDAVNAFVNSIDQIVNIADLQNLKPVLRRGIAQFRETYLPFHEMVKAVQTV